DRDKRDLYQRKVLELVEHVNLFFHFKDFVSLYLAPPLKQGSDWQTVQASVSSATDPSEVNEGVRRLSDILDAYHDGQPDAFNSATNGYSSLLEMRLPDLA